MATNATVTRTRTIHPTLAAGSVAAVCVGVGLLIGVALGASLAQTGPLADKATSKVSTAVNPTDVPSLRAYAPGRQPTELQLRSNGVIPPSAPGNPYVNIHMTAKAADQAAAAAARPGTSGYVNIPDAAPAADAQHGPSTSGYVNIPDGVVAARLPIAAPGNPRVTIPASGSSPVLSTGAGLDEQRRGERGRTGASLAEGGLSDPALQEHGRGERAGN